MTFQMLQIKPVPLVLSPEAHFVPDVAKASALITARTRAIVLVSPNNPTGQVYSPATIDAFADLAKENGIALVLDETYRDFVQPLDTAPHSLFFRPDWSRYLISLFSFSKSYKIPGHRLGGIVADEHVLESIATISDCMQICPPRPPQLAVADTLPRLRHDLAETSDRLHARHKLFREVVEAVGGWTVECSGGFFAYVKHPFPGRASIDVSELLAKECGVITLPGAFFMPEKGEPERAALADSALLEDRWIRFAVANVGDDAVRELGGRLQHLAAIMK